MPRGYAAPPHDLFVDALPWFAKEVHVERSSSEPSTSQRAQHMSDIIGWSTKRSINEANKMAELKVR
jgi:thiamine monophosphate synthase